jgi:hypothetical protein
MHIILTYDACRIVCVLSILWQAWFSMATQRNPTRDEVEGIAADDLEFGGSNSAYGKLGNVVSRPSDTASNTSDIDEKDAVNLINTAVQ